LMRTSPSHRLRLWRRSRSWALAVFATAFAACSEDSPTGPPAPCVGEVEISVGSEATPSFGWSPSCGVGLLRVTYYGPDRLPNAMWTIAAADGSIAPGVRFGRVPAGAVETMPVQELTEGREYVVAVYAADGAVYGRATFGL
jgi:hypothetical protein